MFDKLKGNLNKIKNDIINEAKDIKSDIINEYNNEKDNLNKEFNNAKAEAKTGLAEVKFNKSDVEFIVDTVTFDGASKVVNAFDKSNIFDKSAKKLTETATKLSDNISENDVNFFKEISREKKLNNKKELNILNNMISENLNSLIEFALADGELSEKEKQILFKKAESEGIDLDEFEMILEAKLFQIKQMQTPPKPIENINVAPKSDKFGDIKKCPACGAITESFATKCLDCGTEFRNIESSNSVIKFFEKLDEIESTRNESFYAQGTRKSIGFVTILLWLFFWPILIFIKGIQFLIDKSKSAKWSTTDSRKEELVMNYPVPVSKEAIFEFLTLSSSKIYSASYLNLFSEQTKYKNAWNKIWLKKIDQINTKAKLSMKGDSKTLADVENLTLMAKRIAKENNKKVYYVLGAGSILILLLIIWNSFSDKKTVHSNKSSLPNIEETTTSNSINIIKNENNSEKEKNENNSLAFLKDFAGKEPSNSKLLENPILKNRLISLINKKRYEFMKDKWMVESTIIVHNNIFQTWGCEAHNCDVNNFIIVIDLKKDKLFVGYVKENEMEKFGESDNYPTTFSEWINAYNSNHNIN